MSMEAHPVNGASRCACGLTEWHGDFCATCDAHFMDTDDTARFRAYTERFEAFATELANADYPFDPTDMNEEPAR